MCSPGSFELTRLERGPPSRRRAWVLRSRQVNIVLPCLRHRVNEHALRPADRSNSLESAFADTVIDCAPRDAEQLGCMVQGNAATDTRFKAVFGRGHFI